MEISEYPQLFLDDVSVARMVNLRRELQAPVKHPGNPLIVQDKPWEKRMLNFYGTVLYEPDRKKFRCWYLAREEDGSIVDRPEGPITAEYLQCYAESDDGLRWTKPPVGWEKFGAYDGHNVLIYSGHGLCVLREPDDSDPAKCYKGAGGPFFGFSPDGLRWTVRDWKSAVGKNDTGTSVVRWKGEYLAFVRNQAQWEGGVLREVGLTTSRDFETWTPKTAVFKTDDIDGSPWVQPYGLSVTAWGDCLIGILWVFHLDKIPGQNRLGYIDTQLVTSRDGRSWTRVADRATFLTPTPGAWDRAGTWAGTTMFVKDDRVWIYYTGTDNRHGEKFAYPGIGLATLPADRFVALKPSDPAAEGVLETVPLQFRGNELIINADGDVKTEILGPDGEVVEGFDRSRCRLTVRDPLRRLVRWDVGGTEKSLAGAGRTLTLRFILNQAALYAFTITE